MLNNFKHYQKLISKKTDDNTLCYADYDLNNVISKLESDSKKMLDWFANNLMQANPEKFQALAISKKTFKEQICLDLF